MNVMKSTVCIGSLTALLLGCTSPKESPSSRQDVPDTVEVFALHRTVVHKKLALPAELLPWQRAELRARLPGYVREVRVDIGDRVKKNQVLYVMDAPEVVANSARSAADLEASLARYQNSLDRYRRIVQAAEEKGAVAEAELQQARSQLQADSAAHESARSATRAEEQMRDYLILRAPFDGVITGRFADPGAMSGAGDTPLAVLEDHSRLRLRIAVPEIYSSAQPTGRDIQFTVEAMPSRLFSARLERTSGQIDPVTRSEIWEYRVGNSDGELKSGMYATAQLGLQRTEDGFLVPFSSVVTNMERNFVIRVRDGKAEWVEVSNGFTTSDGLEIYGDLHEGDRLVAAATDEIVDGQTVYPK
jgi:membrane fusion protein, multidrug efflux system